MSFFRCSLFLVFLLCTFLPLPALSADRQSWLNNCDVVWDSPGADARGSMPLGNGEVTLNAWVETNGDLQFYIGRSDSYSEISRLLKVGLIRVSLSPNPFQDGQPFSQHLRLRDGVIEISGGGKMNEVTLDLFADPDQPVIYVTGKSAQPEEVTVAVESWRTQPRTLQTNDVSDWTMEGAPFPLVESADQFLISQATANDGIVWYHRNETSVVPDTISLQGLASAADAVKDPLLRRTFGGYVTGDGFVAQVNPAAARDLAHISPNDCRLMTRQPVRLFSFRIACPCAQTESVADWLVQAADMAGLASDMGEAMKRNVRWWHDYWERNWIDISGAGQAFITRGCILQRYMQACGGRGTLPIKFNGGAFTVPPDGKMDDSDYRKWGDCHWWQNIRHMYYPMMESGDFEMTDPFFQTVRRRRADMRGARKNL